jgi:hypothetical protein
LGNVASKDAKIYFGDKKDLIDFISERFKNYMATTQFEHLSNKDLTAKKYDEAIIRQLWFYRLFYFKDQKDTLIRRGDIIQEGDNNKVLYMVISGDCDLKRFWHKNFGHLSVLPLHLMAEGNTELIEKRLCLTRAKSKLKNELCQSSLTGKMGNISEAAFILPFLKIDNVFRSFLGLPASLTSIYIPKPTGLAEGKLKSEPLKYGHLDGYKYMFTISEPFLTPLIQKVLNDISGLGVPDFNTAEEIVKTDSNKILK